MAGCIAGVALGTANLDASTLLGALFTDSGDPTAEVIVRSLRIPRVVGALVVGACLGASGALLQSATRNPLGDPQIFGLGGGAAIVQAMAMAGILGAGPWGVTSLSVAAALIGALLIYLLASRESLTPARLALVGVSIGALTLAVAAAILTHARVFSLQALALFSGSLANRGWDDVIPVIPFLALGIVLAILAAGRLNLLLLGDRLAGHLGASPKTTRLAALLSAGVLAGAGVSLAGVVGFVGLLTPPRREAVDRQRRQNRDGCVNPHRSIGSTVCRPGGKAGFHAHRNPGWPGIDGTGCSADDLGGKETAVIRRQGPSG